MTKQELIDHLQHLEKYTHYSEDAPALREVIEMLKCSEMPNGSVERTQERTEDIDKCPTAMEMLHGTLHITVDHDISNVYRVWLSQKGTHYGELYYPDYTDEEIQKMQDLEQTQLDKAYEIGIQSAQPDLSEYSDKLWRSAYERGKREAQPEIIYCKDCKYLDIQGTYGECGKGILGIVNRDDFCSRAERREE